ncbi:MAG: NAD(P)H-dependent oxidoreductase [Anaerolineae bacterium]
MKIVVLNGSPKGDSSVTIHSVKYLQKKYPEHDFDIVHIAKRIKGIEQKRATFDSIIETITAADGVLWAFPLYVLMVPAPLKRFIELIHEHGAEAAFAGKYTAAISTSIHFYDHIAHRYIQAVCDDLDMKFVASFPADMMDLMNKRERTRLIQFGEHFLSTIQNRYPTTKRYPPLIRREFAYLPDEGSHSVEVADKKVLVVTDAQPEDNNLQHMLDRFCAAFDSDITVVNLHDLKIVSGCIGCLQCGYDNQCVFDERDDFIDFYHNKVLKADLLVFAGTITDRYLSALWKTYFDRSFVMGHRPSLYGKQLGFIISGPLHDNANLSEFCEGYAAWQHANIVAFVSDNFGDSQAINTQLEALARQGVAFANSGYVQPSSFLGVGAQKVFRDEVWGRLRTVFQADHRAYVKLGWYDFPMRDIPTHAMAHLGTLGMSIPKVRKQIQEMLKHGVSFRHRKIVEKA